MDLELWALGLYRVLGFRVSGLRVSGLWVLVGLGTLVQLIFLCAG